MTSKGKIDILDNQKTGDLNRPAILTDCPEIPSRYRYSADDSNKISKSNIDIEFHSHVTNVYPQVKP